MIISHSQNLIFFSAPKTGSESVRQYLAHLNEEPVAVFQTRTRATPFTSHMPPGRAFAALQGFGLACDNYRTISCVRDPFERLVSLFKMLCSVDRVWNLRSRLRCPATLFNRWLQSNLEKKPHPFRHSEYRQWEAYGMWPAFEWSRGPCGESLIDFLIPTQFLDEELPVLCQILGVEADRNVPRINTRPGQDSRSWYSKSSLALVEQLYAEDLSYIKHFSGLGSSVKGRHDPATAPRPRQRN